MDQVLDKQTTGKEIKQSIEQLITQPSLSFKQATLALPDDMQQENSRLFKIGEISQASNVEYRHAMANLISHVHGLNCRLVYIVAGTGAATNLYIGVCQDHQDSEISDHASSLSDAFSGNFLGSQLNNIMAEDTSVQRQYQQSRYLGFVSGIPTENEEQHNKDDLYQGIERLANSLLGKHWQLTIVAEPIPKEQIEEMLSELYQLATDISQCIKTTVQFSSNGGTSDSTTKGGSTNDSYTSNESYTKSKDEGASKSNGGSSSSKSTSLSKNKSHTEGLSYSYAAGGNQSTTEGSSTGTSHALTTERVDIRFDDYQQHITESLIGRFKQGLSKGMLTTKLYISAKERSVYQSLASGVKSIFQGDQATLTPLNVHDLALPSQLTLAQLLHGSGLSSQPCSSKQALVNSHLYHQATKKALAATALTINELSLIANLPNKEIPGIRIRKNVDFAVNINEIVSDNSLSIGHIVHHGRQLRQSTVAIDRQNLTKHTFVTGVTGAGKTTTCITLLQQARLPYLVIEPAKTEYRALSHLDPQVQYYCLGRDDLTMFRLNPFQLFSPKQHLSSHISKITATIVATLPMEAAMPTLLEEAIAQAYIQHGWDLETSKNFLIDQPWAAASDAWPTFTDVINQLESVIKNKGMGQEFEEKYLGSLKARLTKFTMGINGTILNSPYSINFDQLLNQKVVIELDEIKDEQDKALLMGLILYNISEAVRLRHSQDNSFRHLTLIEEAHRLLAKPEPGQDNARTNAIAMFTNMLAEVRKYGEGLIIADQIPNKLVADVIKNTNLKIVHRLFAADDRQAIGDAMGLNDEQKDFLSQLLPGETIVYSGGWHAPIRMQVSQQADTNGPTITEVQLKQRAATQLEQNISQMLPNLSAALTSSPVTNLAQFISQASAILRSLSHLFAHRNDMHTQKIRTDLSNLVQECADITDLQPSELGKLVAFLAADIKSSYSARTEFRQNPEIFSQLLLGLIIEQGSSVQQVITAYPKINVMFELTKGEK